MQTKGERREQKRNNRRKMKVSGRGLAKIYQDAIIKRKAASTTGRSQLFQS